MNILDEFDKQVEIPVKLAPGITYGFSSGVGFKRYDAAWPKYDHHDYWNIINVDVVLNPITRLVAGPDGKTTLEGMVMQLERNAKAKQELPEIADSFIRNSEKLTHNDGMIFADRVLDQIQALSPIGRLINRSCVYTLQGLKILSRSSDQITINVVLETQVQVGVYVYYFMIKMTVQQPISVFELPRSHPTRIWD